MQVIHYLSEDGSDVYQDWIDRLRDLRAQVAIYRRVDRLMAGNFGDHRFCREGVWELRVDVGAGYRVYYGKAEDSLVLLLCGGDKRSQSRDIDQAVAYWNDFHHRRK